MCEADKINQNGMIVIMHAVCEFFDVDGDYVRLQRRDEPRIRIRHMFNRLSAEASFKPAEIAKFLGCYDRTTVMSSIEKAQDLIDTEPRYKQMYETLKNKLGL